MKVMRSVFRLLFVFLISVTLFTSCTKDDSVKTYSYFVSKEPVFQLTRDYITSMIITVSETYPEINNLKTLVASDVMVYKIVYKTTVEGHQINASGLVCVPLTPGDYPVLSFQNGTNTLNSSSPSEFPSDYSYQMIEFIASMGYIVVIADYPGFGESAGIPHPYLLKEPTVRSLVDLLFAVKELTDSELPEINLLNKYYLLGYSQGGWATLALHKALEQDYKDDFSLKGSACGAGPYDLVFLMDGIVNEINYPMPVYLSYIFYSYSSYSQFPNPVTDIFNEPYAGRINSLYTGLLSFEQINNQLTTSIPELIKPDFLTGYDTDPEYADLRNALISNSIDAWHTYQPLLLIHGANDTQVNPVMTENIYNAMIQAGTSENICKKSIIPDVDHGEGVVPGMIQGILFLNNLNHSN